MKPRPDPIDPGSRATRAREPHDGRTERPAWSARWWRWTAFGSGLLLVASLLVLLPSDPSPPRAPGSVADRSANTETPSLFTRVRALLGLGALPERRSPAPASVELDSRVNALHDPGDSPSPALAPAARAAGSAGAAPLSSSATNGEERSAAPPAADDDVVRDARVTGRVLDATGGPIGGAVVRVFFQGSALEPARTRGQFSRAPAPNAEWVSDANGRFEGLAPSGGIGLTASAEAYVQAHEQTRAPARDIVIVLAPAARVSGRVLRGDGAPVGGASINIQPRAFNHAAITGASDERGEFSIGGVPAGVIVVTASAAGFSAAREWLHLSLAEVTPPILLTLKAAHSVYGIVLEPDGSPCTSGMVQAGGRWQQMGEIDAQGHYRVDGLDIGTHELTATCFNAGAQAQSLRVSAEAPPSIQLDWRLDAGFAVTGSVHLENGEPVAGASVRPFGVAPPEGAPRETGAIVSLAGTSCNTDADGEFRCDGLRGGWYRVNAGSPSGSGVTSEPVHVAAESEPHVALIMPDSGEVRVRLAGPATSASLNGLFLRGVFARGKDPFPIPAVERGDRFVFEALALGRYRIAVGRATSELGPSAVDIELTQAGQVIELELRDPEPLDITGTVVDGAGEPLPDAWVDASLVETAGFMALPFADPVLTSAEGSFRIGGLPPGRYAVRASHPSGEGEALDVAAGQSGIRLVVRGFGSLSGSVTGVDGQPARDFNVLAFREGGGQPLTVDGDGGSWALPWLPPGDYRVVVMSPSGGASTNAQVKSGDDTALALQLDPGLAGQAVFRAYERQR